MYQLEEGGAVFWVIAGNHVEAVDIVLKGHFEVTGETPKEFTCELADDKSYTFDLGHDCHSFTPGEWVSWAGEPRFLACSEY